MRHSLFGLLIASATFAIGLAAGASHWRSPYLAQSSSPIVIAAPSPSPKDLCAPSETNASNEDTKVDDRYYNYDYGFSVDLPRGMIGAKSPAPMPNHGFVIDLENPQATKSDMDSRSTISVDASYNSLMWESFDDAINDELNWVSEGGNLIRSLNKTPSRLGGLRAMRFVQIYENGSEPMVNDVILAFRKEHSEEVVYTISLNTPLSRYKTDKSAVAVMLKTFCLQPLP